jgi:hypothetical protein
VSWAKLANVFELFSLTKWLFAGPHNHHSVFYLLEIFNNQLLYQWEGASALVLSLLRLKHIYPKLSSLEVPQAPSEDSPHWRPDAEWLQSWKDQLQLEPFKVVIDHIDPKIQACIEANPSATEDDLVSVVKKCALVGLLRPLPISVRAIEPSNDLEMFLAAYSWVSYRQTLVYAKHNQSSFAGTTPKLFEFTSQPAPIGRA